MTALEQFMEEETIGDPCSCLKWKHKSLRRLSAALAPVHSASAPTVGRLLGELDYSRKVNRKQLGSAHPNRDEQFQYLLAQKQTFLQRGWPVIHVDSKKRELVGAFKNPGSIWCRDPYKVNVYDFRSLSEGLALPYGIYDPTRNAGFVFVGTSSDTSEFAVDAISWWWNTYAQASYSDAPELLILADGGGSNGCRPRLWKYALQHRLVNPTGIVVTVCHYPTGASKWNWVEHRLFGPISVNWAGEPLTSYAKILNFLNATTTQKGLVVKATLSEAIYQTGIKITDEQMSSLNLVRHSTLPKWNYTIKPSSK
jgi:hypothetical protein